jgi:hypothetical protein
VVESAPPEGEQVQEGKTLNISEIEKSVKQVLLQSDQQAFIHDLLLAYGKPKAAINRLQTAGSSSYNLAKEAGVVLWKSNVCYIQTKIDDPAPVVEAYRGAESVMKHKPRFILATDFKRLSAFDTKTEEKLDIQFIELGNHFHFFLPWAGMEKARLVEDSPADVKAAERMAKLYDLVLADNPPESEKDRHSLNVFLSRILFCYFAESTDIFPDKLFSKSIQSHTNKDGSDVTQYLQELFNVLNEQSRSKTPGYLKAFPYVNGGLFAEFHRVPEFNRKSRDLLIHCGIDLDWSEINPDIFGSMIQAVVDTAHRETMGMHYTSVTNIMKVIEPLFLTVLREEFQKSFDSAKKLEDLLSRLTKVRVFDPACGSGNFLIIAYKELRKLEMEVLDRLGELRKQRSFALSGIQLSQFYGIELDDFAHEVAILSLWLAEHQMNRVFLTKFGKAAPALPLKPSGNVVCGNASLLDWSKVCPRADNPVYMLGNPPYYGSSLQTDDQKSEMQRVFADADAYKNLDYIATWFYKASQYLSKAPEHSASAFVTTSSICQGEQVAMLWPMVFQQGVEIYFSHAPFKWENNAKKNASVSCVIVGLRRTSSEPKFIFGGAHRRQVENINPYLVPTKSNVILPKRREPLWKLPPMTYGSKPTDGGHLLMEPSEKDVLLKQHPKAAKFIKKFIGASEHTRNTERWCLWIENGEVAEAKSIPPIAKRIAAVKAFREESTKAATRALASVPHRFGEPRYQRTDSILVPIHGSERRTYIPFGFLDKGVVASNATQVIYTDKKHVFGLISSRLHNAWIKASCGKIKEDPRYSSTLGYNNFPVPQLTQAQIAKITACTFAVLVARENHSELSLTELYDPDKMPADLAAAHLELDKAVESCYRSKAFTTDEERLEHLFRLYEAEAD